MSVSMSKEKNEWDTYWQAADADGEVFVGEKGEKNNVLKSYWTDIFSAFSKDDLIVDIASGAGSIYRSIDYSAFDHLYAVDASKPALASLKSDLSSINIIEQDISEPILGLSKIKRIVSQFGIEYGGVASFEAAIGQIDNGGSIHTVSHIEDSTIQTKQKHQLSGIALLHDSRFFSVSKLCVRSIFDNDKAEIDKHTLQFRAIEPNVRGFSNQHPQTLTAHILNAFQQMMQRLSRFDKEEVLLWLDESEQQSFTIKKRGEAIVGAALNQEKIDRIEKLCERNNFTAFEAKNVYGDAQTQPIGVAISAKKSV
jgi:hypothetical protein